MPCMSPSGSKSSCWLGKFRPVTVSTDSFSRLCIILSHNVSFSYLYILYLAVDANFKLKGKDRKLQDVELMLGQGIFVEESAYQQHIQNYVGQPEVMVPSLLLFHSLDISSIGQYLSI